MSKSKPGFVHCLVIFATLALANTPARALPSEEETAALPKFIADGFIVTGVQVYCQVFGHWPAQWRDVVEAGLVTVPLIADNGQPIDPDDGQISFEGDVTYYYSPGAASPQISTLMHAEDGIISSLSLPAQISVDTLVSSLSSELQGRMPQAGDTDRWLQFGISRMCNWALLRYANQSAGPKLKSWADFLDSGYAPVDAASINPLTGQAFRGDGSANDLRFEADGDSYRVRPMDETGECNWALTEF